MKTRRHKYLIIWTKEQIITHAHSFQFRKDWVEDCKRLMRLGHPNYVGWATKNKFYEECISGFEVSVRPFHDPYFIYVFEFSDSYAYVGLTLKPDLRKCEHLEDPKSSVFKHYKKCQSYAYKIIQKNIALPSEAKLAEKLWIAKYKTDGWKMVNRNKGGSLGGICFKIYTKNELQNEGKNYKTRTEWYTKNHYSRMAAIALGPEFYENCCAHMPREVFTNSRRKAISNSLKGKKYPQSKVRYSHKTIKIGSIERKFDRLMVTTRLSPKNLFIRVIQTAAKIAVVKLSREISMIGPKYKHVISPESRKKIWITRKLKARQRILEAVTGQ